MTAVLLVIHLILAISLVIVVLIQRSDGGALGGLGGGSFAGLMSGRQSANLLTRTTSVLAACFMATSLLLAIMASRSSQPTSILDQGAAPAIETAPAATDDSEPAPPPGVPVSE
ncbi:MAG: preprotein translocase subunit SecG [Alphaproteobacteria bacterium]|jgi:preprotein translocase subunit SecG|nr:preprotein translocase subunit SecG [Alphaproteobacteria bacterium]MDP6515545.1 preprotein translocase subunit SecG [Alphaproteobacteria bacterium]|tara:strand:+ start:272 stop:613 length:342 start_codon:yes stop_codon:yes gene_type:complete